MVQRSATSDGVQRLRKYDGLQHPVRQRYFKVKSKILQVKEAKRESVTSIAKVSVLPSQLARIVPFLRVTKVRGGKLASERLTV